MDGNILLTLKEAAELECKDYQNLKKKIQRGKINAEKIEFGERCGYEYRIRLSDLSEQAQKRYYADSPEAADNRPTKKEVKRTIYIENLNEEQRQEAIWWENVIMAWRECVFRKRDKVGLTEKFVQEHNEMNDRKITVRTLSAKNKIYKEYGVAGLADYRKSHSKRGRKIDERVWQVFASWYLDENKISVSYAYENLKHWAKQEAIDVYIPSEATFRRAAEEIPQPVVAYFREGMKVYQDQCEPFLARRYEYLESNEFWSSDYHTLDMMVKDDITGEVYRPHMCTWIDIRSRKVLAVRLRKSADSHGVILAFRDAVLAHGLPWNVYLDNGREFLVHDFGGKGKRKTDKNAFYGTGILERAGIRMVNAQVANGKAKVIERSYKQVTSEFAKLYKTYCGNRPGNRPHRHKSVMKNENNIPLASEVLQDIENYLFGYYNNEKSQAEGLFGDTPNECYSQNLIRKRTASADQINLMLLRNTKLQSVSRNGVYITIAGTKLWYYDAEFVSEHQGQKVFVRYDPDGLESVRVYDSHEKFMAVLDRQAEGSYDMETDVEAVKRLNASKKKLKNIVKNYIGSHDEIMKIKPLRDVVMAEAIERREKYYEENSADIIVPSFIKEFSTEERKVAGDTVVIDFDTMIASAKKRRESDDRRI